MRPDQAQRIAALGEKLADVVIQEADPDNWPGDGKMPVDLTQQERGDRYWAKRNAAASMMLLQRTVELSGDGDGAFDRHSEEDLQEKITKAEKDATKLLKEALDKAKKPAKANGR
jgi:hypothetical protein